MRDHETSSGVWCRAAQTVRMLAAGDTLGVSSQGARIIAIVDACDAMTSQRLYQKSRTPLQALEELYTHAGSQFDAELVQRF
jgi:HD domain